MEIRSIKNATVCPLKGDMDNFTGGIFDQDKNFITDSIPSRGSAPQFINPEIRLSGTYIYGGCIFGHFGHFIWESLARLGAIRKCNNFPVLFISPNEKIFEWQKLFFKSIHVKNELILVRSAALITNLVYSTPQSSFDPVYISDCQLNALESFDFKNIKTHKKVWLSRSGLKSGLVLNEKYIEERLVNIGYEIMHPELLPLSEQVKIASASDVVAGFDGSQFFSFLFSNSVTSKFFVFNRRFYIPPTIKYAFDLRNVRNNLYNYKVALVDGDVNQASANYIALEPDKIIETLRSE